VLAEGAAETLGSALAGGGVSTLGLADAEAADGADAAGSLLGLLHPPSAAPTTTTLWNRLGRFIGRVRSYHGRCDG
jgi:hypothetical protein